MEIQPTNVVQFIFVFQMIFGICLIWQNKRYRGLCYLLIFSAFGMVFNLAEELAGTRDYYLVTPIFLLGKGPLFYFFVYQLVYSEQQVTKKRLIHLCPMLFALAFTQWPQLVIALGTLSQLFYACLSIKIISFYHKASFSMRSDADSLQLFWLIKVLLTLLLLGVLDLLRLNLQPNITIELNLAGQLFENSAILLLISYLIFKAVNYPILFNCMSTYEHLDKKMQEKDALESDALKNEEFSKTIFMSLERIIKEKSLHHKSRLSLNDLAKETGLNTREISRAINQGANCNFCDYINKFRVEDLKDKLLCKNNTKFSILDMAFDVGFSSKSSFNLIFKRETGITPTQFMKKHLN
ncbi:helix-turn-helix domain-containing protein [Algibacillus agarilyticus]|uniref:helix-turn-helix domain-containing protein n=1 Tax=Algibacillus agarilyticus TaxID=2234133 RepID=UPI0013002B40|nr:AraC family transcriptional regulator [Algibacillus agarilyticus]